MRTRSITTYAWSAVVWVVLAGCTKEYTTLDAPGAGGSSGATADTLSFSDGWEGDTLPVDIDGSGWIAAESLGHLDYTLHANDRVFAVLQVGLQWPNGSCMNDVYVSAGTLLGNSILQTPGSLGITEFSDSMRVEPWPEDVWVKQFVRVEELTVSATAIPAVFQAYVKVWSSSCGASTPKCNITNKSLTLIIVHEH